MRAIIRYGLILASGLSVGGALAAPAVPGLIIENAAVRLVVVSEPRRDFSATISGGAGAPALKIKRDSGDLVVDGGLSGGAELFGLRFGGVACRRGEVKLPGRGWTRIEDLPLLTVRAPLDPRLSVSGAAFGRIGETRSLALAASGCGELTVRPVEHAAAVRLSGSPKLSMSRVSKGMQADLAGSARLNAAEASGPLRLAATGSSRIDIAHGKSPTADMRLTGSGEIRYGGEVGTLDTAVTGSGNVRVGLVFGTATSSTRGMGRTYIGRPKTGKYCSTACS